MKFNEKLIKLRKKSGLSQEELGYQLNVTRQTVSKWELGQTTPEMNKLVEMSKLFGVTLDELTDNKFIENESVENGYVEEVHNKKSKSIIILVVIILIVLAIIGVDKLWSLKNIWNDIVDFKDKIVLQAENLVDTQSKNQEDFSEKQSQIQETIKNQTTQIEQALGGKNDFSQHVFNSKLELYSGTENGFFVKNLIDKIVTSNKKEKDKIITVIYQGTSVSDPKDIQELKTNFEDMTEYEVSFEYDENGYIYQAEIK